MSSRLNIAWIHQSALDFMTSEASRSYPMETGGVLGGYWSIKHHEVVITDAIGPGPRAVHTEDGFIPDSEFHYSELARLYQQSGRLHGYLGDWHTHPDGMCALSRKDRLTLRRIASYPPSRAPFPLMGILAGGSEWNLELWCYFPRNLRTRWWSKVLSFRLITFSEQSKKVY